ncbi:MAG: hypothetical protein WD336_05990, partial [Trueperaceae bacterium]
MEDAPDFALELLEYKVDDLRHRRPIRGGSDSLHALRRWLDRHADRLMNDQRERLRALGREVGMNDAAHSTTAPPGASFDDLVLTGEEPAARGGSDVMLDLHDGSDDVDRAGGLTLTLDDDAEDAELAAPVVPLTEPERREQEALQRLARRLFRREVERFAENLAAAWRAERERITPRLLYAALRNLDRYRETPEFARDVNLRQFRVVEPMPARVDPLVSLSDLDSLIVICRDVVESVLYLRDATPAPQIERSASLDYLRKIAFAVASDPYAGERSAVKAKGPRASELRSALRDLARERLPDWQRQARREDLEARLREREDMDRQQRTILRKDTLRFAEHVDAFFARLSQLLPKSVGGQADEPQLSGGVLFALSPGLRRNDLSDDLRALTLRMVGPVRLTFAGRPLIITVDGAQRHLFLGDVEVNLSKDQVVTVDGDEVEIFVEGDYLHVRLRETGASLAASVAEAAAVVHAHRASDPLEVQAMLRLLSPGAPADPTGLVVTAVRRAGQIVAKAPDRLVALRRLLQGTASAIGYAPDPNWLSSFAERIDLVARARPEQLPQALALLTEDDPDADPAIVVPFTGDPVDVPVGGRSVTVRQYGVRGADHLVAMVPGQVI